MKKLLFLVLLLAMPISSLFSQEIVGKIVRSNDSVFINGKYYNKLKSQKTLAIGDEINVCCGGSLIIHLEKNAKIVETKKTLHIVKFKIAKPEKEDKNSERKYAAYTTLSAASRGGIFDPPLNPPNGATAFLGELLTLQWNKPGNMFIILNTKNQIVFKKELNQSKEYILDTKEAKLKKGKYYWRIDNSDKVEINFIK